MTKLIEIINAVQSTSGKNAKRDILKAHSGNELLKSFLRAVYDPRINYYITKTPVTKLLRNPDEFDQSVIDDLFELANRTYTGKVAKDFLHDVCLGLDEDGKQLVGYIIGRDIRAGIAENTILDVFPGLFFIPPYQRCASMDADLKDRFNAMDYFYVQSKSDGQFAYVIQHTLEPAQAMSRAGSIHPNWVAEQAAVGVPLGFVAMGELLIHRHGKLLDRKTGNGILNSALTGDGSKFNPVSDEVKFLAWDLVTLAEFYDGKSDRPYEERLAHLAGHTGLKLIPTWTVMSTKHANEIQAEHVARGEEGTVWKDPGLKWRDCSSGDKGMMKAKIVFEADYIVKGYYEGEGRLAGTLGGLELATSDDLIQFRVGSGFNDEQRKWLWSCKESLVGQIVAAEGNDIVTSKGKATESVFLPIFVEIRTDKREADSRDRVWAQLDAAKLGKSLTEVL